MNRKACVGFDPEGRYVRAIYFVESYRTPAQVIVPEEPVRAAG